MAGADEQRDIISLEEWAAVMKGVLNVDIDFAKLKAELLDDTCCLKYQGGMGVDWKAFLNRYRISMNIG